MTLDPQTVVAQILAQFPRAVMTQDATVLHLNDPERTILVVDSDGRVYEAADVAGLMAA